MMDGCCRFLGHRITMLFSLPSSRCVHFEPFCPYSICLPLGVFLLLLRGGLVSKVFDLGTSLSSLSSVCKQALLLYLLRCVSDNNICLEGFFAKFCF